MRYVSRIENEMYADFRTNATNFVELGAGLDSWDYLAAMQHYGVATRLLDWTTSVDMAMYFATALASRLDSKDDRTWPAIWILNPYRLNRLFVGEDIIFDKADPIPFDYYQQTTDVIRKNAAWPHSTPIALDTGYSNERLKAQNGKFTLHGSEFGPIEEQKHKEFWYLERVVIDPNDLGQLKTHFARDPASHFKVYPDIQGYVMSLNAKARV